MRNWISRCINQRYLNLLLEQFLTTLIKKLHQPCIYGLHQIFQLHSVLDVDRMLAKSSKDIQPPGSRQSQEAESGHPVIRTLYDHFEVIICSKVPFQRHEHEKCAMIYSYMAMHSLVLTKTNKSNCSKEMKEQKKRFTVYSIY